MGDRQLWWKRHGEPLPEGRWKCLKCGMAFQSRGGRFAGHLWEVHALKDASAPPTEDQIVEVEPPTEVEVKEEEIKAKSLMMSRDEYKEWLLGQMKDPSIQAPARVAAGKVYGEVEGYLGDPPEKDWVEKEKVWRAMHEKAISELNDIRALMLHELSDPIKRGEIKVLLEEAEKV